MTAEVLTRPLPRRRPCLGSFPGRSAGLRRSLAVVLSIVRFLMLPLRIAAVPALVALTCGAQRGADFDRGVTAILMRNTAALADWLAGGWVHPRIAAAVEQLLNYAPLGLLLLALAVFVARLHNFLPLVCISWIAVLEGRKASWLDLSLAFALPVSLGVTLTRYDSVSWFAWGAFTLAYLFTRWAYNGQRLTERLKWVVRVGGDSHNGGSGMSTGN